MRLKVPNMTVYIIRSRPNKSLICPQGACWTAAIWFGTPATSMMKTFPAAVVTIVVVAVVVAAAAAAAAAAAVAVAVAAVIVSSISSLCQAELV